MIPGVEGVVFTVTARVRTGEEPQALFAVTEMVPLDDPAVAIIEFVTELPDQPLGKVQE